MSEEARLEHRYSDEDVLAGIDEAFSSVERPDHFTHFGHCCECAEHDALLLERDRDTLAIEDVGSQAWNPITMATPEGFAYYLPALARLALDPLPLHFDWYGYIILFELRWDGPRNDRWRFCTPEQRKAVALLLEHLFDSRADLFTLYDCHNELLEALVIWSE
jgi:hypothetical protein